MKVMAKCDVYIDGAYRAAGAVFDYNGKSDVNLTPVPEGGAAEAAPGAAPTSVTSVRLPAAEPSDEPSYDPGPKKPEDWNPLGT